MKTFVSKIVKSYGQNEIRIHASSATFYIVVSALPLVFILVYILSFLSPVLQSELENLLNSILPSAFYNDLHTVIVRIKKHRLPTLIPFGVITALWGSTKGVDGLCYGAEVIYGTKKHRHIVLRWLKTAWRTLVFYLVFFLTLLVFALSKLFPAKSLLFSIILNLRILLFAAALSVFFAYFYSRLANTPIKNHFLGGIFASVGWMIFTFLYSIYVTYAVNSSSIYAETGTIIFFMLWVYFCVNIILLGASLNRVIFN